MRPTHGLKIDITSGRSATPSSRRIPSTPNRGPGSAAVKPAGSSRSVSRTAPSMLTLPKTITRSDATSPSVFSGG